MYVVPTKLHTHTKNNYNTILFKLNEFDKPYDYFIHKTNVPERFIYIIYKHCFAVSQNCFNSTLCNMNYVNTNN